MTTTDPPTTMLPPNTTLPPTTTLPPNSMLPLRYARPAVVVHDALRREIGLAAPLVRDVRTGDTTRAVIVGDHLRFMLRTLQHHHELEDEVIWPLLLERGKDDLLPIVEVMLTQHDELDRHVSRIVCLLPTWTTSADATSRDRLADLFIGLNEMLVGHIDLEERVVLPVAETHLSVEEWRAIGRNAVGRFARNERTLSFGMLQHQGAPEVLAMMLEPAPAPVRLVLPWLARRAYRRHATSVYGRPNP